MALSDRIEDIVEEEEIKPMEESGSNENFKLYVDKLEIYARYPVNIVHIELRDLELILRKLSTSAPKAASQQDAFRLLADWCEETHKYFKKTFKEKDKS